MKKINWAILYTVIILSGCRTYAPGDYMSFSEVSYIGDFPVSVSLTGGEQLHLGVMGIRNLRIIEDSLMIISTVDKDGFWSIFHLPDCSFMGKVLKQGRGQNEVTDCPRAAEQFFYLDSGDIYADVYDFYTGDILNLNLTQSICEKSAVVVKEHSVLEKNLFNVVGLGNQSFFCREVNSDHTMQSRFLLSDGIKSVPEYFSILNQASIAGGKDINILGTYSCYSPEHNCIVEAGMGLSVINLYSLDKSGIVLSICPEKELSVIAEIQSRNRREKWMAFRYLAAYPRFFAALYHGDTAEHIELGNARGQVLQLFDWDGCPLAEFHLERDINSFDIDFENLMLYTLNYETDEIYRYQLPDNI